MISTDELGYYHPWHDINSVAVAESHIPYLSVKARRSIATAQNQDLLVYSGASASNGSTFPPIVYVSPRFTHFSWNALRLIVEWLCQADLEVNHYNVQSVAANFYQLHVSYSDFLLALRASPPGWCQLIQQNGEIVVIPTISPSELGKKRPASVRCSFDASQPWYDLTQEASYNRLLCEQDADGTDPRAVNLRFNLSDAASQHMGVEAMKGEFTALGVAWHRITGSVLEPLSWCPLSLWLHSVDSQAIFSDATSPSANFWRNNGRIDNPWDRSQDGSYVRIGNQESIDDAKGDPERQYQNSEATLLPRNPDSFGNVNLEQIYYVQQQQVTLQYPSQNAQMFYAPNTNRFCVNSPSGSFFSSEQKTMIYPKDGRYEGLSMTPGGGSSSGSPLHASSYRIGSAALRNPDYLSSSTASTSTGRIKFPPSGNTRAAEGGKTAGRKREPRVGSHRLKPNPQGREGASAQEEQVSGQADYLSSGGNTKEAKPESTHSTETKNKNANVLLSQAKYAGSSSTLPKNCEMGLSTEWEQAARAREWPTASSSPGVEKERKVNLNLERIVMQKREKSIRASPDEKNAKDGPVMGSDWRKRKVAFEDEEEPHDKRKSGMRKNEGKEDWEEEEELSTSVKKEANVAKKNKKVGSYISEEETEDNPVLSGPSPIPTFGANELFVLCFAEDLLDGQSLLLSQLNNLYKLRCRGLREEADLDYRSAGYIKLYDLLKSIPGLCASGKRNGMRVELSDRAKFLEYRSEVLAKSCSSQLGEIEFRRPRKLHDMLLHRLHLLFSKRNFKTRELAEVYARTFNGEQLNCSRDYGHRDLKSLLASVPFVEKVQKQQKDAVYSLKPECHLLDMSAYAGFTPLELDKVQIGTDSSAEEEPKIIRVLKTPYYEVPYYSTSPIHIAGGAAEGNTYRSNSNHNKSYSLGGTWANNAASSSSISAHAASSKYPQGPDVAFDVSEADGAIDSDRTGALETPVPPGTLRTSMSLLQDTKSLYITSPAAVNVAGERNFEKQGKFEEDRLFSYTNLDTDSAAMLVELSSGVITQCNDLMQDLLTTYGLENAVAIKDLLSPADGERFMVTATFTAIGRRNFFPRFKYKLSTGQQIWLEGYRCGQTEYFCFTMETEGDN